MATKGPIPDPNGARAARGYNEPVAKVPHVAAPQPHLPLKMPDGERWPARTRAWWRDWGLSPLTANFGAVDWAELMIAAILHGQVWRGDTRAAMELRMRMAKFGATTEDRKRLHIEYAEPEAPKPARPRRELRLVGDDVQA